MQVTIARQLGLDPSTVSNFFMNARRRSVDKWKEDHLLDDDGNDTILGDMSDCDEDDDDQSSSDDMSSDHFSQIQAGTGAMALARYTDGIVKVLVRIPG